MKTKAYVNKAVMLGWSRGQVDAWAATQSPPVSAAEIDAAYAACVDDWLTDANTPDDRLFALHVARREDLYFQARAAGDLALAHKILIDKANLQQQYKTAQRQAATASAAEDLAAKIRAKTGKAPALKTVTGSRQ